MTVRMMNNIHGTAVSINGTGVVIMGGSGIGKTETALGLIDRGHQLIADDTVVINSNINGGVILSSLKYAIGYMHLKGVGFINIGKIYNEYNNIKNHVNCDLIVTLTNDDVKFTLNNVYEHMEYVIIENIKIPNIILPIGNNRNLPLIIECIVKNYQLMQDGYNAHKIFLKNNP